MKYVQAPDGVYARTVEDHEPIVWDDTHFCAARQLTEAERAQFGVYPLTLVTPPPWDRIRQGLREVDPAQADGAWCQQWEVYPLPDDEVEANRQALAADERSEAKRRRAAAVAAIQVTTRAGNTFDGDEESQGRMARAILVLSSGFAASVLWVLADNRVVEVSAEELTEALALAGRTQTALWPLS